jgi:hypothetical protein
LLLKVWLCCNNTCKAENYLSAGSDATENNVMQMIFLVIFFNNL